MNPLLSTGALYSSVYFIVGIIILWVAKDLPQLPPWSWVKVVGWMHIMLGMLCVFSVLMIGSNGDFTECVDLPNSSTTTGLTTTYTYVNTCDGYTLPPTFGFLTKVYAWMLFVELGIIIIVIPIYNIYLFMRKVFP